MTKAENLYRKLFHEAVAHGEIERSICFRKLFGPEPTGKLRPELISEIRKQQVPFHVETAGLNNFDAVSEMKLRDGGRRAGTRPKTYYVKF
jgi:hypothetical protein